MQSLVAVVFYQLAPQKPYKAVVAQVPVRVPQRNTDCHIDQ